MATKIIMEEREAQKAKGGKPWIRGFLPSSSLDNLITPLDRAEHQSNSGSQRLK